LYFRNDVRKFVLFLVARVGSTYLTTLLQSHPEILALSEELRDRESHGAQAQLEWTERFLTPPIIGAHAVRGFNVKLVHLADPAAFGQLLQKHESLIVHMYRRNRVKAVVSRINGGRLYKKTGMWGLFEESNRMPPLEIDPGEFDEFLKHREKVDSDLEEYVDHLGLPLFRLCYEDLLVKKEETLGRLFSFLGARPMPVVGQTLKITSDDLRAAIVNFDQLRANYVGTEYEPMFDEVLLPAPAPTPAVAAIRQ
jgi:LPS sulfotransferase NodH